MLQLSRHSVQAHLSAAVRFRHWLFDSGRSQKGAAIKQVGGADAMKRSPKICMKWAF